MPTTTSPKESFDVPQWSMTDRLVKARKYANLHQADIAERTGLSAGTISNYESGKTTPRRPQLLLWSMACGVPFAWLETGECDPDELRKSSTRWSEVAA